MLATCRLGSWVGLHPEDLRMGLLRGKIYKSHVNVVCSYGVKLTTFDLLLPAVVARDIQLSKT